MQGVHFQNTEEHITFGSEQLIRSVAAVIVSLFVAFFIFSFPARRNGLDFSQGYSAAQIVRQGLGTELYNLRIQLQFQSKVASVHVFYNHPF